MRFAFCALCERSRLDLQLCRDADTFKKKNVREPVVSRQKVAAEIS
jgi:hypothetical protein